MKTFKFNMRSSAMVQADGCTIARQTIGVNPTKTPIICRYASCLCLVFAMLFTLGVGEVGAATKRYYCKCAQNWWNTDEAAVGCYAWKSSDDSDRNADWPGKRMQGTGNTDEWYIDLDTKYDRIIFVRVNGSSTIADWGAQTGTIEVGSNNYYTITSSSACWKGNDCYCSYDAGNYAPTPALVGDMNSWDYTADIFSGSGTLTLEKELDANERYEFKILDGLTYYTKDGWVINNPESWTFDDSGNNCILNTENAGTYTFTYNKTSHLVTVSYPNDRLTKQTYVYFNDKHSRATEVWKEADYSVRLDLKNYQTDASIENVGCLRTNMLEDSIFYFQIPNNDNVGRIKIWRTNPTDTDTKWNSSNDAHACWRDNAENCLSKQDANLNWWDTWVPQWSTYCPPMSSATLTHDASTVTYGGNGGSSTPYLVATSSFIKVSATSVSALNDANMAAHYQFKKGAANDGDKSATATHTYTASGTNGTTEAMTVVAQNNYNSTYGTASPASNAIYYKACTPYSVTHTLVGVTTTTGKTGASATVHGAVYNATFAVSAGYDMPTTVTVTIGGSPATLTTDYTWNSSTGALQIKANKITGNVVITVHGVAKALTFTGATTSWSTASNWSPACVPTIEHDITINKPAVVDIEHAAAKSIVLDQSGEKTGKLTIQANKGLEVEGTIRVKNKAGNTVVTTPKDLILQSSSAGNASLIFANTALDDRKDSATVYMYSKAEIPGSGHWNWQYIGLPFDSANATYTYYGSYIHKFISNAWAPVANGETLYSWQGYSITNNSATTYEMEGELVSTKDDVEIELSYGKGKLIGNSWTAPINIESFTTEGEGATFTSTPATIYLFNTGNTESGSVISIINTLEPGQYISIPVNSASSIGIPYIAPMQGFWISADTKAGSVTLKYDELVRPASERAIVAGAMRAPKREQTERPQVMKIFATGARYSDRVTILSREDFSRGFDNGWDGEKISFGEEAPSIYVINGQGSYDEVSSIPEYEGTVIGFRSGMNSMATISFDYDGEETLYLNDLKDQTSAQILTGNTYDFITSASDDEARFIISATPIMHTPTAVDKTTANDNKVQKIILNDHVYIIRNGRMYDATGVLCK